MSVLVLSLGGPQGDGSLGSLDEARLKWGLRTSSVAGAAAVTVGLLYLMGQLIAEEFVPNDVVDLEIFEINPTVIDLPVTIDLIKPDLLERIEVPPAPPSVDIPETTKPTEPIVRDDFTPGPVPTSIDIPTLQVVRTDGDPTPIVRVPPMMPPRADRSGHCLVSFDIGPDGRPFNVSADRCSQSLFRRAAVQAVEKWVYNPEIRDGLAVTRTGLEIRITFQLRDERGRIIPE